MSLPDGPVMIREVGRLARDLRDLNLPMARDARAIATATNLAAVDGIHIVGNGDSAHAALAAEWTFDRLGVSCEAMPAQRFLDHGLAVFERSERGTRALIALSASGRTPTALEVLARARALGAITIGVTTTRDSELTRTAGECLVADLAEKERSPGIRTYQACVLGLLRIAMAIAGPERTKTLESELSSLDGAIDQTVAQLFEPCRAAAEPLAAAPAILVLGSGPQSGTSRFAAAKLVEGAGVPAFAQDLDEWRHVERLIDPRVPLIVLAPPGTSSALAAEVAGMARRPDRSVVVVAPHGSDLPSTFTLPVRGTCDEALSPLLYSLFAPVLSTAIGHILGRAPFQN